MAIPAGTDTWVIVGLSGSTATPVGTDTWVIVGLSGNMSRGTRRHKVVWTHLRGQTLGLLHLKDRHFCYRGLSESVSGETHGYSEIIR